MDEPRNAMSSETDTMGFFLYEVASGDKLLETVEQVASWQRKDGMLLNGSRISIWDDENLLEVEHLWLYNIVNEC